MIVRIGNDNGDDDNNNSDDNVVGNVDEKDGVTILFRPSKTYAAQASDK